ncbi:MAG TPA: 4-phosphoerythronate dehydrogenase PdxB [Marinobacterium sp.]|nr:4-phosphoerythronate dehydrogenase PdxB [Marinobacterium sp.]
MLRVVADENMPAVEALFGDFAEITRLPGRQMQAADLKNIDILLVRSITGVDADLLSLNKQLGFVGTATIGIDHLDTQLLDERGIRYANAPGCNADAVVDYTLSGIYKDAQVRGRDLSSLTIAVVGCGEVGSRLKKRLEALGHHPLTCDPLRASETDFHHLPIDEVVQRADIICLHTPLTRQGEAPSRHLLNEARLRQLKPGALLVNAGRGAVIDNAALLRVATERQDLVLILDVWEHEPSVDPLLAQRCFIATPHIAGHSIDGKLRGSWMLYQQVCDFYGLHRQFELADVLPSPRIQGVTLAAEAEPTRLMQLVYDQWADDRRFRASLVADEQQQRANFDQLRKSYPYRREFAALRVAAATQEQHQELVAMGFNSELKV